MPPSLFITSRASSIGFGATPLPGSFLRASQSGSENLNAAFYAYTNTAVAINATAFQSYRAITSAFTITLPKLRVNQWVVIARDQTAGTTTVGRNGQTIDGSSADFTMDTNKIIILFICTSTDTLVTRLIGNLPT